MKYILSILIVFNLLFSGCAKASVSRPRNDYILANDHGWIEIGIIHEGIESISGPEEESVMPLS